MTKGVKFSVSHALKRLLECFLKKFHKHWTGHFF